MTERTHVEMTNYEFINGGEHGNFIVATRRLEDGPGIRMAGLTHGDRKFATIVTHVKDFVFETQEDFFVEASKVADAKLLDENANVDILHPTYIEVYKDEADKDTSFDYIVDDVTASPELYTEHVTNEHYIEVMFDEKEFTLAELFAALGTGLPQDFGDDEDDIQVVVL